jgi:hypothetical protein
MIVAIPIFSAVLALGAPLVHGCKTIERLSFVSKKIARFDHPVELVVINVQQPSMKGTIH